MPLLDYASTASPSTYERLMAQIRALGAAPAPLQAPTVTQMWPPAGASSPATTVADSADLDRSPRNRGGFLKLLARGWLPLSGIMGAATGYSTPTSEYRERFGLGPVEDPSFLSDLGIRALGVGSDVVDAALFGLPGMLLGDYRQVADAPGKETAPETQGVDEPVGTYFLRPDGQGAPLSSTAGASVTGGALAPVSGGAGPDIRRSAGLPEIDLPEINYGDRVPLPDLASVLAGSDEAVLRRYGLSRDDLEGVSDEERRDQMLNLAFNLMQAGAEGESLAGGLAKAGRDYTTGKRALKAQKQATKMKVGDLVANEEARRRQEELQRYQTLVAERAGNISEQAARRAQAIQELQLPYQLEALALGPENIRSQIASRQSTDEYRRLAGQAAVERARRGGALGGGGGLKPGDQIRAQQLRESLRERLWTQVMPNGVVFNQLPLELQNRVIDNQLAAGAQAARTVYGQAPQLAIPVEGGTMVWDDSTP